jgi:hypothetical protein
MTNIEILLLFIVAVHLVLGIVFTVKIFKVSVFTQKQKVINTVLIFAIPFIWVYLIYYILQKTPSSFEVEKKDT